MRKNRFAIVAAIVASALLGTAPTATAAAYPTLEIKKAHLQYGATYLTGTITFYDRSVGIDGLAHYVGCRTFYATSINVEADGSETELDFRSSSPGATGTSRSTSR